MPSLRPLKDESAPMKTTRDLNSMGDKVAEFPWKLKTWEPEVPILSKLQWQKTMGPKSASLSTTRHASHKRTVPIRSQVLDLSRGEKNRLQAIRDD